MTRRQTGAPGLPPRQPAGAQGALVIQEPRVSAEAKSRRQLAATSAPPTPSPDFSPEVNKRLPVMA